jgi:hypothetical protein
MLISRAENQPKSESFWEKVEDRMIQYAYEMVEKRKFIDTFFIPGIGGGKQDLEGSEGLYAIIFLLPSIWSEDVESTSSFVTKLVGKPFKAFFSNMLEGKEIEMAIEEFHGELQKTFGENVASFYLPYQRMMFRGIAIVWIKSNTLAEKLSNSMIKGLLMPVFYFSRQVDRLKIDLEYKIISAIETSIIDLIKMSIQGNIDAFIEVSPPSIRYNNETNTYTIKVTASTSSNGIRTILNMINQNLQGVKDLRTYYHDVSEITNIPDPAQKSTFESLFEKLRDELKELEVNVDEKNLSINVLKESEVNAYDEEYINTLKRDAKEELKNKLIDVVDKEIREQLENPFKNFLNNFREDTIKALNTIYNEAEEVTGDIIDSISSRLGVPAHELLKDIIGPAYIVINAFHQAFTNGIKDLQYEIKTHTVSLIEKYGEVRYGEKITGSESFFWQWLQGICIKGTISAIVQSIPGGAGAMPLINTIPQFFIFDIGLSKNEERIVTGSKPGMYSVRGRIRFRNLYSIVIDSLKKTWENIHKKFGGLIEKFKSFIFGKVVIDEAKRQSNSIDEKDRWIDNEINFIVPYIVAPAIPAVRNVEKIDNNSIAIKMAAIMDVSSFIRVGVDVSKNVKENARLLNDQLCTLIRSFLEGVYEELAGLLPIGPIEEGLLVYLGRKTINYIGENVLKDYTGKIIDEVFSERLIEILKVENYSTRDFVSLTTSVVAIPVRGMRNKLKIITPSISISEPVDGLGYCEIIISKESLINFSAPVSAIRSYVAFSDGDAIGMIPYSIYSYEPLVVQVFTEISSWPNTFNVRWIPNPEEIINGISIVPKEMHDGRKLVMCYNPLVGNELRYIPNPYPYVETYVKLNIG